MSTSRTRRIVTALVLVTVLAVGAVIAVAVRSASESARVATDGAQLVAPETGADSSAARAPQASGAAEAVDDAKIVKTATLSLTVPTLDQGATGVRQVAQDLGGQVTDERLVSAKAPASGGSGISVPPQPPPAATITISVPADQLDVALQRLSVLGAVEQRTTTARDVTTTYVDTESRIATQKASVERVRALMAQATAISQIAELESQLAQRESELESLQSRFAALQRKVAMSTVTVTLSTGATDPATGGFVGGLRAGWDALLTSLAVCLTVIGAVLPVAVALALLALPVVVWWRRRRSQAAPAAAREPEPAAAAAGANGGPSEA